MKVNFSTESTASFEILHCGNALIISDFQYSQADAIHGNPYNTAFHIKVVSGVFSGIGECEYDMKEFIKFAEEINDLYEFQRSEVKLQDICYGSFVDFKMSKTGHLEISGEIYGHARENSMKFRFSADQTSLKNFAESLKQLYSE